MIIVENKGINTINIPKNSLSNIKYSGGNVDLSDYYTKEEVDELIDNVEVDLTNYYTKEEIDNIVENTTIPYLVINSDWSGYEAGDFESVRQAIGDKKPYFIYAPAPLGGYFSPNYAQRVSGQINCHFFYHTDYGTNYYYFVYLHSDRINKSSTTVQFATTDELSKKGVYGLVINYNEEYNEYTYNGVGFSKLKQAINNGEEQYAIYLPNSENTYRVTAQEIIVDGDEIKCKTIETNGSTQIITNWTIGEDEYGYEYCKKGTTSTINIATQDWIKQQGYLTSIPSEYVTESELTAKNYATKSEIPTIPTNVSSFTNDAGYITNTALDGYATETYVSDNYQVKGNYLTSVPDEYVTDTELTNKGYATTTYVDNQIGNINTILENIIG